VLCTHLPAGWGVNQDREDGGDALGVDLGDLRFFGGGGLGMLGDACVTMKLHVREG
jgi:anti-anti-sigma regulatory factor